VFSNISAPSKGRHPLHNLAITLTASEYSSYLRPLLGVGQRLLGVLLDRRRV
jgi:hypothetical protein